MDPSFKKCLVFTAITIFFFSCQKGIDKPAVIEQEIVTSSANKGSGATQIAGVGFYAASNECDYETQGAAYAIKMTGELQGCLYAFIDEYECSPSGTYREEGREYFVGTYNGQPGTFWTTYKFEAKYDGCSPDGAPMGAEIFGRCQHPVVAGSGTGVFNGVSGQINFKDDIEAGNFPYRGQLRW
jgi:hypothetical protein